MNILIKNFLVTLDEENFRESCIKVIKYLKKKLNIRKKMIKTIDVGVINHYPLVSLIAVNYNGENDLPQFLDSIRNQTYKNFELIIVDNNSSDNSRQIINNFQKNFKRLIYLNSDQNLGFSGGNNYAIPYCNGEFFGLINVDTVVDNDWLKELVDSISIDGSCGAVCSKTLFFNRFQDIEFNSNNDFQISIDSFLYSLKYKKFFIRQGNKINNNILSSNKKIIISLPVQDKKISFRLLNLSKNDKLKIIIGKNKPFFYDIQDTTLDLSIDFSPHSVVNSSYIINNAGSIDMQGMPSDRGIGEYDVGQYNNKCYVDYFCGVSVLLRRSILVDRKIFVTEFFAYYEDSELSKYIREKGYKILYNPASKLYHKHSATSSEGSPLWQLLVSRSQTIYTYNGNYKQLNDSINHIETVYKNKVNSLLFKQLKDYSDSLIKRLKENNFLEEKLKPIGIYNSYWNTKGGGERHALSFATFLQQYETVYLISETDFSIQELSEYYNIDLSNCRKIVETNITTDLTVRFDIFINSTYRSNLISKANRSYYIVSFPHKDFDKNILNCYEFLYNSEFTRKYALKFWGHTHQGRVIYPIGHIGLEKKNITHKKEKLIISVGRFFIDGHSKNQHIIASAFKNLMSHKTIANEWKLVLIGSIDNNSKRDIKYLNKIHDILKGTNYQIITNANYHELNDYYRRALIYVHATGYGQNIEKNPENFEHFGITPVEAMMQGCYPIVYKYGGPAELLSKIDLGSTFESLEELSLELENLMIKNEIYSDEIVTTINNFILDNNVEALISRLLNEENDTGL